MKNMNLKEIKDRAEVLNMFNDAHIDSALKRLESEEITKEERSFEVDRLRSSLKARDDYHKINLAYTAKKEGTKGYAIGLGGAVLGFVIGTVGCEILAKKAGKG